MHTSWPKMCCCQPRVREAPLGANLPVSAADVQKVRYTLARVQNRPLWPELSSPGVSSTPPKICVGLRRIVCRPASAPRCWTAESVGSRAPEPIPANCNPATEETNTGCVRLMYKLPALAKLEDSPQVHYLVETCLTRHMTQPETVQALQAVGVAPCFTDIGAAAVPPSAQLVMIAAHLVVKSHPVMSIPILPLKWRPTTWPD